MKILAVDTSCATASCAVTEDGRVLGEIALNHARTHASHLLPAVHGLLALLGMDATQMDAFAVVTGPGSFTGLRIGVVTMKTLAYATEKPLVGVSSLESLAATIPEPEGLICPMIDARNRQVFCALFRNSGSGLERLSEDAGIPVEHLAAQIRSFGEPVTLVGDAADTWSAEIARITGLKTRTATGAFFLPRAASAGILAAGRASGGGCVKNMPDTSAFDVNPRYLRPSQAERMKTEQVNSSQVKVEHTRIAHAKTEHTKTAHTKTAHTKTAHTKAEAKP